jgi:molecular chaperone DnaK
MGTAIYAQAQAEGSAQPADGPEAETPADDEVVEAEIVEDEKPGSGGASA